GQGVIGGATFAPIDQTGSSQAIGRIKLQYQVRGPGIQMGMAARLYCIQSTTNAIMFVGPICYAMTSPDALGQPEIACILEKSYLFDTSHTYAFKMQIYDQSGAAYTTASSVHLAAERLSLTSSGLTAWVASHTYAVGDVIRPSTANGHAYRCTATGTVNDATEPTWPTGDYATVQRVGTSPTWMEDGSDSTAREGSSFEWFPFNP